MARCKDCIHYGVCAELEEFRDPLCFTDTKGEFGCSSYFPADVAPRAEVDFLKKTIAENAQKALEVTLEEVENAKREVAKEIFEEIESEIVAALNSNYRAIAEHQEKYGDNVNLNFLTACYAKNNALRGMEAFVEDLKKKYVEGQK